MVETRRWSRIQVVGALAAVALLLGACSDGDGGDDEKSAPSPTAPPVDPGEVAGDGACALLGIAEVEEALGADPQARARESEDDNPMQYVSCRWWPADGGDDAAASTEFVDVAVIESADRFHDRRDFLDESNIAEGLDGVGDDAYVADETARGAGLQVAVLDGDRTIEVVVGGEEVEEAQVVDLARVVLVRA